MTRNERVRLAVAERKVPQRVIAEELGVRIATVNSNLNADEEINSIKFIETIAHLTGFSKSWLAFGTGMKIEQEEEDLRGEIQSLSDQIKYLEEKERQMVSLTKHWMGRASEWEKENIKLQIERQKALEELEQLKGSLR
jgi:transcriptional regulator with XRE-family HTH domain